MKRAFLYVLWIAALWFPLTGCSQSDPSASNNVTLTAPSTLDASTDPRIRIIKGSLTISGATGTVELKGTRGFRLSSEISVFGGVFAPTTFCPCPPGTTINLTAVWGGSDLSGQVRLKGTSYAIGQANGPGAEIRFAGQVTAPPANTSGFVEVSAPFSFEGLVQTPPESGGPFTLTGHGEAHLQFTFDEFLQAWRFLNAVYEFEPSASEE